MKVLFVASVFYHLTTFHVPYMRLLQSKGYEVWAAADGNSELKALLEEKGVRCINVAFSRSPLSASNFKAYQQMKQLLREQEFELVHVHTPVAAFLTRLAFSGQKKGKILYTAHGFHFYEGAPKKNWYIFYNAEKMARKWTDGLIVMNSEDHRNAMKLGFRKDEVFYVHGVGVDIPNYSKSDSEIERIKKELDIKPDSLIISFVAELNDNKNHQFLLRNWKVIVEECPRAVLLLIGTGDKEAEWRQYIEDNKLLNVKVLGYRNDVPEILKVTDIVTLLSKREGLPKSIMEAMAYKIPCIVTDTRGLRDLINDGENGFVVPHEDDVRIQQAFIDMLQDVKLRQSMGERGYELVQPYAIDRVLKEYELIYRKYLNFNSIEKE
ncbi:colanic acid biosynthesis glycosyltransferase WcaL [Peribacillus asahii]|uniref:Colanic acid biosynthesis glycosyltransferase WcaL n=1 Tax=Peribacillus asahii TaxID=228899 RepID=A0A3Q9RS08_9BACI|nr:glycosyltransferase family 4 protein [Peribacillus asahii]AZV45332.1 colanic acid biosynthesis glycosyltransferase WcaL [Peribacillus asahii]